MATRKRGISDTRIAAAWSAAHMAWTVEPHENGRDRTFQAPAAFEAALGGLTEPEARVLEVLLAYRVALDGLPAATLAALRTFVRRRSTRRAVAALPEKQQRANARARAMVDSWVGRTRPVDPLSALCVELRDRADLTDTEIVRVLHATGIEAQPDGYDPEAARQRVYQRRRSARKRAVALRVEPA